MSTAPTVSVVIASIVGPPFIDDCLASLFAQKDAPDFEVIVADCRGPENVARLAQRFSAVRSCDCSSTKLFGGCRFRRAGNSRPWRPPIS